jgi:hypothetical protein
MINLVFVQYLFTGLLFHAAPFLGCWERGPRLQLLFLASSLGWLAWQGITVALSLSPLVSSSTG